MDIEEVINELKKVSVSDDELFDSEEPAVGTMYVKLDDVINIIKNQYYAIFVNTRGIR